MSDQTSYRIKDFQVKVMQQFLQSPISNINTQSEIEWLVNNIESLVSPNSLIPYDRNTAEKLTSPKPSKLIILNTTETGKERAIKASQEIISKAQFDWKYVQAVVVIIATGSSPLMLSEHNETHDCFSAIISSQTPLHINNQIDTNLKNELRITAFVAL